MSFLEVSPRALPSRAPGRRFASSRPRAAAKRILDLGLSISGLLLLSPLLAVIAFAVTATSRGPALFRQRRVGRDGALFTILKFRTFDAAGITPLGRLLRRTNLDELPQLLNVLRGEMSIVGPRPLLADMAVDGVRYETLVPAYARRHAVRPGLTGPAQVAGLRGLLLDRGAAIARIELDLAYVEQATLRGDLALILRTLWQELRAPSGS